jgi:Domain of unknown function (DUF5655)
VAIKTRQNAFMAGQQRRITEAALTRDLPEDLREAWERLRETAVSFGEQRIYASHHSIMFSRKTCYFFVRPKQKYLEVCVFLGRRIEAPQVRKVDHSSRSKFYHLIRITHRDEVEAPITDWLREAYELPDEPSKPVVAKSAGRANREPKERKVKNDRRAEAPTKSAARPKKARAGSRRSSE